MRNPIRLKNLSLRFLPLYLGGVVVLVFHPPSVTRLWFALPLLALGLCLRGWGAGHLVKNHELTTSGPYAHLRHPLYLGTILVASGFAIWLGGWLSIGLLCLVWPWFALHYFPRKERSESARLEELYGSRFTRYRNAVPALWPRWTAWRAEAPDTSERRWDIECYSENNELGTLLAVLAGAIVFALRTSVSLG